MELIVHIMRVKHTSGCWQALSAVWLAFVDMRAFSKQSLKQLSRGTLREMDGNPSYATINGIN
jgi:hypothetical protein